MNPELQRNLWLEFSRHRLIAAPVLVVLVLVLILAFDPVQARERILWFSGVGFVALVMLWGTQLASASVLVEAQDRTWDAQRMSALGAWPMTWGKLLGAPAFAWYGGGCLLVAFLVAGWDAPGIPAVRAAVAGIAGAVALHALALSASVFSARRGIPRRTGNAVIAIAALVVLAPGLQFLGMFDRTITWWGLAFASADFVPLSAIAFACWAVLGACRTMCEELEIRTLPWALPAFVAFAAVYACGFLAPVAGGGAVWLLLLAATAIALAAMYLLLFAESTRSGHWQRLATLLAPDTRRRLLQELPVWLVALLLAMVCAVLAVLPAPAPIAGGHIRRLLPLGLVGFAVRDAALLQFFALMPAARRVEATAMFYLALLYLILPGLLRLLDADALARLVLPDILGDGAGAATLVVAVQAALAVLLARWQWRRTAGRG